MKAVSFRETIWYSPRALLRFVVGRFRGRPDSEHEMVINRLVISLLILTYLFVASAFETRGARQLQFS